MRLDVDCDDSAFDIMKIGKKEKNIPVPTKGSGPEGVYKATFDKLAIGESQMFYDVNFSSIEVTICRYNKNSGRLIVSRQVKKTGANHGDKRVWRLA